MVQVAEKLVQKLDVIHFFGSFGKWARVTNPDEEFIAYKIERGS